MIEMSVKIGNIEAKNPLFTASGTFGYGSEISDLYDVNILGGIVTKTITRTPRIGNPPQRVVETTAGMLNSIGLANVGIDKFITDKMNFLKGLSTNVIVNIAGESEEDFLYLVDMLEDQEGIAAYELNLSCPNVSGGLDFSVNPNLASKIVEKVKSRTKRPVIPKLTPNVTDIKSIAKAVEDGGADAISLINTLLGMAVDIKKRKPVLGNVMGGLSGPAIKPVALAKVYQVYNTVNIPIMGIGGISNANDVIEFLLCGAAAVQLGTINFVEPTIPIEILKELETYLENNSINSVKDLTGSLRTE
ncbi:dihydroorotate dehydrogenase [candidate division KSB1 bacterium]